MSVVDLDKTPADGPIPRRARRALGLAGGLVVGAVIVYLVAFHDVAAAQADAHAYVTFSALGREHPRLAALAQHIVDLCQPLPYVYLAAATVVIALVRRRWTLALALAVMIPAAILTTEVLKPLLAHPRPALGVSNTPLAGAGSWPSGHSTAAMTLAMAFVLASPARWRPYVAAVGTAFALAVIYSLLSLGWHYPSDAIGGVLVASIWSLVAVAAVWTADARFGRDLAAFGGQRPTWLASLPSVPVMIAAGLLPAVGVVLVHAGRVSAYAADNTAFVAAVMAIGVAGALAPTTLTVVLSGSDRAARAARPGRSPRD